MSNMTTPYFLLVMSWMCLFSFISSVVIKKIVSITKDTLLVTFNDIMKMNIIIVAGSV